MEILFFDVPTSMLDNETKKLEIVIKYFSKNTLNESSIQNYNDRFKKIIEKYIKKSDVNANTFDLYFYIFNDFEYFYTYHPKIKGSLANNKILIQLFVD